MRRHLTAAREEKTKRPCRDFCRAFSLTSFSGNLDRFNGYFNTTPRFRVEEAKQRAQLATIGLNSGVGHFDFGRNEVLQGGVSVGNVAKIVAAVYGFEQAAARDISGDKGGG